MPMIMWSVFVCLLFGWVWMMIVFVVCVSIVGLVCSVAQRCLSCVLMCSLVVGKVCHLCRPLGNCL